MNTLLFQTGHDKLFEAIISQHFDLSFENYKGYSPFFVHYPPSPAGVEWVIISTVHKKNVNRTKASLHSIPDLLQYYNFLI